MEQAKPAEAEQISKTLGQDSNTNPDPKYSSQAPNEDGGVNRTSFVMGSKTQSQDQAADQSLTCMASRSRKSVSWSPDLVSESTFNNNEATSPYESNASGGRSPALSSSTSFKDTVHNVRNVLGRWGKSVGEATKKAEDFAGNTWQHCMDYIDVDFDDLVIMSRDQDLEPIVPQPGHPSSLYAEDLVSKDDVSVRADDVPLPIGLLGLRPLRREKNVEPTNSLISIMDLNNFEFDEVFLKYAVVKNILMTYFDESIFEQLDFMRDLYCYFGSDAKRDKVIKACRQQVSNGDMMDDHLLEVLALFREGELSLRV